MGGWFTNAGGIDANGIASWNGTSWHAFGSGLGNPADQFNVCALAAMPNGTLVAAGLFDRTGTQLVFNIAQWNGSAWASVGSGIGGSVFALAAMPNGDLIAGGSFTITTGGVSVKRIARWDGQAWGPLGGGVDDSTGAAVRALAVMPNGDLVAGGSFTSVGGTSASCLALWNGSTWVALGGGVTPTSGGGVYKLLVLPNRDLLVAGLISAAGGTPVNNIALWNGSSWSPLGAGLDGLVQSLAAGPDGSIFAGGAFLHAGGFAANRIARWDGVRWYPLGNGVGGMANSVTVTSLQFYGDHGLSCGGSFTLAGSAVSVCLARWSRACPPCNPDFNNDGDTGTDADIESFFACLAGSCCASCGSADFNGDGDAGTDADIEAFFRVLAGGSC